MRRILLLALVACDRDGTTPPPPTDDAPAHTEAVAPTAETGHTGTPGTTRTTAAPTGDTAVVAGTVDSAPLETTADTGPFAWPPEPEADVIVDCAGGGDFTRIQAAIDASVSGAHIGVRPCRYRERIDFRGKSLDVFGLDGSDATAIDGGGVGPVVRVARGESDGTRLAGFTIVGGRASDGAAVFVENSVLVLEDVVLTGNDTGSGSTFHAQSSRVAWMGGGTTANDVGRFDEPVWANAGVFVVEGVSFGCDRARAAVDTHNVALVHDSTVSCDGDYGWYVERGEILVQRSDFTGGGVAALWAEDRDDNRSENAVVSNASFVGGAFGASFRYMDVDVENSVFLGQSVGLDLPDDREDSHVRNSVMVGADCGLRGEQGVTYDVAWNLFDAGPDCHAGGTNTVTGSPMFVAAPVDLHPAPGSPLIDAGDPDGDLDDPDGTRNDLGRYGGPEGDGPP